MIYLSRLSSRTGNNRNSSLKLQNVRSDVEKQTIPTGAVTHHNMVFTHVV